MRRETSLYLDCVRFSAALVVFLGHVAGKRFTGGFLWPLSAFMGYAVTIFFVLSGYVIAYVSNTSERTISTYAVNRIARIYSVAIPALILTFALDTIGQHARPALYSAAWGFANDHLALRYLSALSFTNELWWNNVIPGSILPYWSLGYEVWYYMIFAAFWFYRGYPRYLLTAAFLLVAGPNILALFPLWLIGFGAYHLGNKVQLPRLPAAFILGSFLLAAAGALFWVAGTGKFPPDSKWLSFGVGIGFAASIVAVQSLGQLGPGLLKLARPIRWFAGMTFSLYLFHLPIAQVLAAIVPWEPEAPLTRLTIVGGTFLSVALLAQVTERQKDWWRTRIAEMPALLGKGAGRFQPRWRRRRAAA